MTDNIYFCLKVLEKKGVIISNQYEFQKSSEGMFKMLVHTYLSHKHTHIHSPTHTCTHAHGNSAF